MKIPHSILVVILMAVGMTVHSQDKAPQPPAAPDQKMDPLTASLAGTRWYWQGKKDHVLELHKDGTAELDSWKLPTNWNVTGPNEITFTMHALLENQTAIVTFTDDRSSFSGTDFRGVVMEKSPRAPTPVPIPGEKGKPLAQVLPGTKWYWEGREDHILEMRKDGSVRLDYWKLPTDWRVTGPNQVDFTMHYKKENKTATIIVTEDRTSFSGTEFRGGKILTCPRVPDNATPKPLLPAK